MNTITLKGKLFKISPNIYDAKMKILGLPITKTFITNNIQLKSFLQHPDSGVGDNQTEFFLHVENLGLGRVISVNGIGVNVMDMDAFADKVSAGEKARHQIFKDK